MKSLVAYQQVRKNMTTGGLLEWSSRSALGSTIRFFTGKNVNHSGLVFSLENYGNQDGQHIFTLEAEPSGIRPNLLSAMLEKFDGEVFWYPLKPEFDALHRNGLDWALQQANTPYDYKTLFGSAFSRIGADARKFICSEYVFIYYVVCGMLPQYVYDTGRKIVVDIKTGKPVKTLRPGEFEPLNIHLPRRQIK